MGNKIKLTEPQRAALEYIWRSGEHGTTGSDTYPPFRKLVALGLVDVHQGKFGSTTFKINDAGRALWEGLQDA